MTRRGVPVSFWCDYTTGRPGGRTTVGRAMFAFISVRHLSSLPLGTFPSDSSVQRGDPAWSEHRVHFKIKFSEGSVSPPCLMSWLSRVESERRESKLGRHAKKSRHEAPHCTIWKCDRVDSSSSPFNDNTTPFAHRFLSLPS
jgi:hypothetical protein